MHCIAHIVFLKFLRMLKLVYKLYFSYFVLSITYLTMSIFQMRSNAYLPVRSACYKMGLNRWLFMAQGSFFCRPKPLKSAEPSWSKLFSLVSHDDSKYHQFSLIPISRCHSLPFFDTFSPKIVLIFW